MAAATTSIVRGLYTPSLIQFYRWSFLKAVFICRARESSFRFREHFGFFSDLNNSGEQHVLLLFNLVCDLGSRLRVGNRWRYSGESRLGCSWHLTRTDSSSGESFFWLSKLRVPACLPVDCSTLSMAEWIDSTASSIAWARRPLARKVPTTSSKF